MYARLPGGLVPEFGIKVPWTFGFSDGTLANLGFLMIWVMYPSVLEAVLNKSLVLG